MYARLILDPFVNIASLIFIIAKVIPNIIEQLLLVYYFQLTQDLILEFATPLLSLYEMQTCGLANLSEPAMRTERMKFSEVLAQILNLPKTKQKCRDKFIIVDFRGEFLHFVSFSVE
jgi:hypothetical protein